MFRSATVSIPINAQKYGSMLRNMDISRNLQYKDIYRKIMNNQHHACILDANYYLSVYNMHFKLAFSTE